MSNIESVYPLTPMQEGMLFHTLYEPESAEYFRQLSLTLDGEIDAIRFRAAWQNAVDQHSVLRTAFVWDDVKQPVQAVLSEASLAWVEEDWRGVSEEEQREKIEHLLAADRSRGFDLKKPPLMRCQLIQLGQSRYQFVWSFHHLVLDGWSTPLVLVGVLESYEALRKGRTPSRIAGRPFRDYILWLKSQDPQRAERFWKEYLFGFSTPTPLGFDRQTAAVTSGYAQHSITLDPDTTARLSSLARDHRLTLNTLLQGVWALLLSRYSGNQDVVFGGVVSGRTPEVQGIETMAGMFVNTVPVRVAVDPERDFLSFAAGIQSRQADAREFEHASLMKMRDYAGLAPRQQLFDSLFVFENYPAADKLANWKTVQVLETKSYERTTFPLTLTVGQTISSAASNKTLLGLLFSYQTARFSSQAIERIASHLNQTIEAILANPSEPLSRITILTSEEKKQIEQWNDTARDYAVDRTIVDFIEQQVARTPEAVALSFKCTNLTYRELNNRANQVANYLQAQGVGPGELVGIRMHRSIEMVVALLGAMKSGGAYVPLDPDGPASRLEMMIADSKPRVVLVEEDLGGALIADSSTDNPARAASPADIAYVIYTSGSTGTPKGAMNTHRGLANRLLWMQDEYRLDATDRVLQKTPYSFDVSVWEFFWPPMTGARLVVAEPGKHKDPAYLCETIRARGITTLHFVPSMLQAFLMEPGAGALPSLRRVICSGEALPFDLQQKFFAASRAGLHNLYGPTEAAIDVTHWECRRNSSEAAVPIGHPIANTRIHILDRYLNEVPPGMPGELHIGGVNVARGYLNRPELTAEKFIPDPFFPGATLYKTGDLARHREDGALEYLGRIDHQIKIRGFRIELGEIESVLLQNPEVREAVVIASEETPGDKRLIAYVCRTRSAPSRPVTDLREFLKTRLPDYMLPAVFVALDAMPLSANGKLDRKALPAPLPARPEMRNRYAAPRTAVEETLAKIWRDVLRIDQAGIEDDFFELGGDSILSIHVVSRANRAGLRITARQLFEHPRIADLAKIAAPSEAPQAEQGTISGDVPLTPIENWWLAQKPAQPHHFNQAVMLEVLQRQGADELERRLKGLVHHHDALRLRLVRTESGWRQFIAPHESANFFSYHEGVGNMAQIAGRLQASLDLENGPIIRAAYFDSGPDENGRLLIVIHHIAVDGVSWRILLEDLQAEALAPKTTSFQTWSRRVDKAETFPRHFGPGFGDVASERTLTLKLAEDETSHLLRKDVQQYLLAALASTFPEPGLRVDVESHGRDHEDSALDLSRTVGWFTRISSVQLGTASPNDAPSGILFNYLGQFDQTFSSKSWFALAPEHPGKMRSPLQQRPYKFEINASVIGGKLHVMWSFSETTHDTAAIERLASSLMASLRDQLLNAPAERYPLSPMQHGMLFHSIYQPDSATYIEQMSCTFEGRIEIQAFERAWQTIFDRHAVLRTAFLWQEVEQPVQVVSGAVEAPITLLDWSGLRAEQQQQRIDSFVEDERTRGFPLSEPPLMRMALARLGDNRSQFIWSWSHLLMDGWCLPILLKEFFALYRGDSVAPTGRYRDYIEWLNQQDHEQAHAFWRATLSGFECSTALPLAQPGARNASGSGEYRLELSHEETSAIQTFARHYGLTLNTVVQGAWGLLLMRFAAVHDVVFGATVSGRSAAIPDVESIVGLFINTLPVRVRAPGNEPITEWLRGIQRQQAESRQYEYTALAEIQQLSQTPNGSALFSSVLIFENYPLDEAALGVGESLRITGTRIFEQGHYPLHLVVVPGEKLLLRALYENAWFSASSVERTVRHLSELLTAIALHPGVSVADLPLETGASALEGKRTAYPREETIHELFEQQARRTPDAIAVVFGDEQVTYAELNRRSNRLMRSLRRRGIGARMLVGISMERSIGMIVGTIAILKSGAAYVPIDPAYPPERIDFMLEDTGCRFVLTREYLEDAEETSPPIRIPSSAPAYVMYTSGSTGQPKGVVVPHRAVVRLVRDTDYFDFNAGETFLQFAPVSFDAATFEIWGALLNGAKLVVCPPHALSLAELGSLIRHNNVTGLFLTTGIFHMMVDDHLDDLKGVKQLLAGGDVLSPARVERAVRERPGCRFTAVYGPTENTTYTTFCAIREWNPHWATVPIGRPIANTNVYVLDPQLRPVPQGAGGELYIGGDGLALGYWKRPELTGERFLPNPFGEGHLYKTGDLARLLEDGNIEFLGRRDTQVKIRGFRIELAEIEHVLNEHKDVKDSTVIARVDKSGEKRLTAYIVPRIGHIPAATELRAYLKDRLPEYMLPANFVPLPTLPLSPAGKVDRNALPDPEYAELSSAALVTEPETAIEQTLCEIWSEVLGVKNVGVHDNFFDLGGDSIQTIRIVARASRAGLQFTPKNLFQLQTVRELAKIVEAACEVPAARELEDGPAPLTPIQKWFFDNNDPEPEHFNQTMLLDLRSPVDSASVREAFGKLIDHHEALRMRFEQHADTWRQSVGPLPEPLPFNEIQVTNEPDALRRSISELERSLNLSTGPLIRAALIHQQGRPTRLAITIHRLVVDDVSWRILLEDLETALTGDLRNRTTSFIRWAKHVNETPLPRMNETESFPIPADQAKGENNIASMQTVRVALDPQETQLLLTKSPPIRDLTLTTLGNVIRDWSGAPWLLVDVESDGRVDADGFDLYRTVGWFTVIQTFKTGGGISPVRCLGKAQISFNYQGQFDQAFPRNSPLTIANEVLHPWRSPHTRRPYIIEVVAHVTEGIFEVHLNYSENLHRRETIELLAEGVISALRSSIGECAGHRAVAIEPAFSSSTITPRDVETLVSRLTRNA